MADGYGTREIIKNLKRKTVRYVLAEWNTETMFTNTKGSFGDARFPGRGGGGLANSNELELVPPYLSRLHF